MHRPTEFEPTRESLAKAMRSFLNSEITAFEFDDQLELFRDSEDPIIKFAADVAWCYYDDCHDHLVCLDKQQWDFFQRLLLLLAADCTIETSSKQIWSARQFVAAGALAMFSFFALQIGWGYHLFLLAVPFGVLSIWLEKTQPPTPPSTDPYRDVIFPFATISDLERAYRGVKFTKTQYPKSLLGRQIRSPLRDRWHRFLNVVIWLFFPQLLLLWQSFPRTERDAYARAT